jgi:hypothetical protein
MMTPRIAFAITASLLAVAASAHLVAQRAPGTQTSSERTWLERTFVRCDGRLTDC